MQRIARLAVSVLVLVPVAAAKRHLPGEAWSRYADPAEAGWSTEGLAAARALWEEIDSAAYMIVEDGVVVAAWGDCERRYMCHSVRKSFLSALYGVHVDAGAIDTEKTLAQLGVDDEPALTDIEKGARIEDLLRARSGVYKLAAYEPPQNPKPPRGSHEPGTFWCYNNFDFNTLGTIFEAETGTKIFEEFDARIAGPLGMQDYRPSDGYYHYELDKSVHPAYPFRLSARDSARFGLLFLREGQWGERRVLSPEWVARSTRSYSDTGQGDGGFGGYGYMWWTFSDSNTPGLVGYAASGVGGQSIAVLPEAGLVLVNRTDTYMRRRVGRDSLLALMALVLAAQPEAPAEDAALVPLESAPRRTPTLAPEQLARCVGTYSEAGQEFELRAQNGRLVADLPNAGVVDVSPTADDPNVFLVEDLEMHVALLRPANGERGEVLSELELWNQLVERIGQRAHDEAGAVAERALEVFPRSAMAHVMLGRVFLESGDPALARELAEAALELDPEHQEARLLVRDLER